MELTVYLFQYYDCPGLAPCVQAVVVVAGLPAVGVPVFVHTLCMGMTPGIPHG